MGKGSYMKKQLCRYITIFLVAVMMWLTPLSVAGFNNVQIAKAASTVKLNKTSTAIYVGETVQLKISGTKDKIQWSTDNKSIASVSSKGKVKGIKKGTATITAKIGKKSYTCKVKVSNQSISATELMLAEGDIETINIKGAVGTVTWKSSNPKIATVDANGTIIAAKEGNTTITGTSNNKEYRCKLTVIKKKIQVTTKNITCFYDNEVMISAFDLQSDEVITADIEDTNIIDCEFGEWYGDDIPLMIKVVGYGSTTVTLTSNYTKQKVVINVNTIDIKKVDDSKALTAKQIFAKCSASTVQINTDLAVGSGFFIDNGTIVTNYHVIEGASKIEVQTYDGKIYTVDKILGYDKIIDIAILSIDSKNESLVINKHGVTVGEDVYSIGSSLGLKDTFTNGIVTNSSLQNYGIYYIQNNAPISSGNSGGPLLNAFGEVIGINTMTYKDGQNINLAVEINQIYRVVVSHPLTIAEFYNLTKVNSVEDEIVLYEESTKSADINETQVLPMNAMMIGGLLSSDEYDLYKIEISSLYDYSIILKTDNIIDKEKISFVLFDADINEVNGWIDGSFDTFRYENYYLPRGTYYIAVSSNNATVRSETIPYYLIYGEYE